MMSGDELISVDNFLSLFVNDIVEEAQILAEFPRRRALWRENPFEMRDNAFRKNFRLSKELVELLINFIEPIIRPKTQYDIKTKVLCALNFFAQGSYQTPVGQQLTMNMSQPSVSRCIAEVVEALNHPSVFGHWVQFPDSFQKLNEIARDFYSAYGFPGVIGCIDCTHVAIVPPASHNFDERSYVNRKYYHSINTQLICDAKLKILSVNALFPGATHDCHIWNNSNVHTLLERLHGSGYSNYHLIGDSGYPLRPWCLTPIQDPQERTPEYEYNEALKKTRCTIERCNGVLKGRFRCLIKDRVLHYFPNKASQIINACTVLHNMCVENNLEETRYDDLDSEQLGIITELPQQDDAQSQSHPSRVNPQLVLGRAKQNRIIQNYFTNYIKIVLYNAFVKCIFNLIFIKV